MTTLFRTALRRAWPRSRLQIHLPSRLFAFRVARTVHTTRPVYAPDRPTSLTNMLASDVPPPVQVSSVGPEGITLADGLVLTGPVIFLEGKVFLWDVPAEVWPTDWHCQWEILDVVVPKPEILIYGTGPEMERMSENEWGYIRALGIQMYVTDTKNACSKYKLLAEEGRRVVAALLPFDPWHGFTRNVSYSHT